MNSAVIPRRRRSLGARRDVENGPVGRFVLCLEDLYEILVSIDV